MNFLGKIFSSPRKEISIMEDESHGFGKLSLEEMDAILGGRPLTKYSEEQEINILKDIHKDI